MYTRVGEQVITVDRFLSKVVQSPSTSNMHLDHNFRVQPFLALFSAQKIAEILCFIEEWTSSQILFTLSPLFANDHRDAVSCVSTRQHVRGIRIVRTYLKIFHSRLCMMLHAQKAKFWVPKT